MSKRIFTSGGVIQRANGTSASGSGSAMPPPPATSRTPAARCAASPSPSSASTAPPGNTHAPPMNRAFGVALDEQHLEPLGAAAQDDHRRRLARLGRRAGVEILSRARDRSRIIGPRLTYAAP